jgi:hypothetical protein
MESPYSAARLPAVLLSGGSSFLNTVFLNCALYRGIVTSKPSSVYVTTILAQRGPAVTEEAGSGDVQHTVVCAQRAIGGPLLLIIPDDRTTGVAVEDPLGGVVGVGFGQAVGGIFLQQLWPNGRDRRGL